MLKCSACEDARISDDSNTIAVNSIFIFFLCKSDTVGRSGVFCAVNNAIEQFKAEKIVDVFQATKAVRMHKPRAVNTLVSEIHVPVFRIL